MKLFCRILIRGQVSKNTVRIDVLRQDRQEKNFQTLDLQMDLYLACLFHAPERDFRRRMKIAPTVHPKTNRVSAIT